MSRHSYGMPRVRDELRLGRHQGCSRTTVARLMKVCGAVGIHYHRKGGCTRPGDGDVSDDLVNRAFDPEGPNRLWVMDVTEHRTLAGKVYLPLVLDAWSRMVVGRSIADHMRAELVADAVQMAVWRRQPPTGQTVAHSDHGGHHLAIRYTDRLVANEIVASVGSKGDSYDNALAESFNGLYKWELIHRHGPWSGIEDVEFATMTYVDWFNNRRRHGTITGDRVRTHRSNRHHRQRIPYVRVDGRRPGQVLGMELHWWARRRHDH